MVKHLTKAGYSVTTVENGRQALKAFEKKFYPFILTDWLMPEMDGLELCQAVRERSDYGQFWYSRT